MQPRHEHEPRARFDAGLPAAEPDELVEAWTLDELERFADLESLRAMRADARDG